MIRLLGYALVAIAAIIFGCKSKPADQIVEANQQASGFNQAMLCNHWCHSPEEQKDDLNQIYRTDGSKLPPSRFRMQYIFHTDGSCNWYYLSPDDKHDFKPGRWKVFSNDPLTIEITKGHVVEKYRVTELTKDILRWTQISSTDIAK